MSKNTKAEDLLKILGQRAAPASQPKAQPKPAAPTSTPPPHAKQPQQKRKAQTTGRRGRGVHLWLHAEDEKLIRELSVWLLPHRRRVNDSLVVKAALRAVKTGAPLLAAYDDALKADGRIRRTKPERS